MRIIKIQPTGRGGHLNHSGNFSAAPEGWAVIPDELPIPDTFPFVNIEVEEVTHYHDAEKQEPYTVLTVTSMTAGVVPDPEPASEPKPTTEERVTELEEAMELLLSGATGETEVAEDEA